MYHLLMLTALSSCSIRPRGPHTEERPRKQNPSRSSQDRIDADLLGRFKTEIQQFWGAPYVWGGASPAGTDCSGLVITLYKRAVNLTLPHSTNKLFNMGRPIHHREVEFGDLVFFDINNSRAPTHVGMYISSGIFLHASVSKGVTLSRLRESPYRTQYLTAAHERGH